MTPELIVTLGREAIETILLISGPMLLSGLIVGFIVSIFQAATQINEQTMTFIPKIFAILVALLIATPWMIQIMLAFTTEIFGRIATVGG